MENSPATATEVSTEFDVASRNDAPAGTAVAGGIRNQDDESRDAALIEAELLIEEISIDGMCGVY
jgi:mycofactocin precursor